MRYNSLKHYNIYDYKYLLPIRGYDTTKKEQFDVQKINKVGYKGYKPRDSYNRKKSPIMYLGSAFSLQ